MKGTATAALLVLLPAGAHAHGLLEGGSAAAPLWLTQALFALTWLAYAFGAVHRRPRPGRRLAFHAGMLVLGVALYGPFDDAAAASTAWHMAQHMLLMVVVAPLLVVAAPMAQLRMAFAPLADPPWRRVQPLLRRPMACAALHAAAIWGWHAPQPYMAAVLHPGLHVLEHLSFVVTGWLFWWSVLRAGRARALSASMALLFTLMHTGLLGAVLTFARQPLYWRESRELWDQQLAGLVMWVPGGLAYLAAAGWLAARWLAPADSARPAAAPAR